MRYKKFSNGTWTNSEKFTELAEVVITHGIIGIRNTPEGRKLSNYYLRKEFPELFYGVCDDFIHQKVGAFLSIVGNKKNRKDKNNWKYKEYCRMKENFNPIFVKGLFI